jgi:hypothetical protein
MRLEFHAEAFAELYSAPEIILILAVAHLARAPGYWASRR